MSDERAISAVVVATLNQSQSNSRDESTASSASAARYVSYSELTDSSSSLHEGDVLMRLKSNLNRLDDMHSRLRFMITELSYLLKKD
jgi:hypothetical protein